jgi:putative ABC transport system permease protein
VRTRANGRVGEARSDAHPTVAAVSIDPGWPVAVALVVLLAIALGAHRVSGYGLERPALVAALRAIAQLGVAALLIAAVIDHLVLSIVLVCVMFAMGVLTTSRRVEAPNAWRWAALAMAAGVLPVVAVVLVTGTIPAKGIALIPIAGIIVGNAMTAHTLVGRRSFAALREEHAQYEACLSLGLLPHQAIREIVHRRAPEALLPGLDQVKTTGVVTLPGAFIGVMLGGGTPVQAATAQVLVLFGIMAAQTVTVGVAEHLVAARRLAPRDLLIALRD